MVYRNKNIKFISIFDVIFAAVLSVFSVLVYNVYLHHNFEVVEIGKTPVFVLKTALFFVCFLLVVFFVHLVERQLLKADYRVRIFEPHPLGVLKGTILISLCYLPVAIIFYPGVCSWDTINQLNDYLTGTDPIPFSWIWGQETINVFLNDHHPVIDTFIFVLFYNLGISLGDVKIGIFIYSLTCMVATAVSFSYMLCFINKMKIRLPRVALLIFLLAYPVLSVYSFSMIKDSVFGVVFVWWFVIYVNVLFDKTSGKKLVALVILSVALGLTKKTGVYIALPSCVALLFAKVQTESKWRIYVITAIGIPAVLMFFILPKLVFPAANIFPGGKQETLGPLFQQTARVDLDHPDYYSGEEKKIIGNVIDYEHIKDNYQYEVSDGIKDTYNLHAGSKEIIPYVKLWFKTGTEKPLSYIKATVGNSGGFFTPAQKVQLHTHMTPQKLVTGMDNIEEFKGLRETYIMVVDFISGIPVISFLFQNVLFTFWIPLFVIVRSIKKRRKNTIISVIPVIMSVLVLIVSPNAHIRYGLPLVYCAPLLIAMGLKTRYDK